MITPAQADKLIDAIAHSRSTSRTIMAADNRAIGQALADDDAAYKNVLNLISRMTA